MNDDPHHERFMRLFLRHEPELFRTALVYVPNRNEAREIVQESAVALWRDFDRYNPDRPFVAWACGYVRIEVRRYLRSMKKGTLITERAAEVLAAAESRINEETEARQVALRGCLDQLPREKRDLIQGYYLDERSVPDLAQEHSSTVESVYKTLQRVRRGLLDCIEGKLLEQVLA